MRDANEQKTYFHYYIEEIQEDGTYEKPRFFSTLKEIETEYGVSRGTVWRILRYPEVKTRFKHRITKQFIHRSVKEFLFE